MSEGLRQRLEGCYVHDRDVDELEAEGFDQFDILHAMGELGHTLGRDKDGWNEWWPKEESSRWI